MLYYNDTMNNGANLLPAHGRAEARATPFLAALFAKQKTKFGGGTPVVERFAFTTGQEARAGPEGNFVSLRGKQKFLLFACPVASRRLCYGARPSIIFQKSASGFSLKKVRILFKPGSKSFYFLFVSIFNI